MVRQRRAVLERMGVEFQLNTTIGKDIEFEQLLQDFDAVFLGMGTYSGIRAELPGSDLPGVQMALPYLVSSAYKILGLAGGPDFIDMAGQRVLVLGGGDTAMDCNRTAIRQGASEVNCVYRRDAANIPGSHHEVANAEEEGVTFLWNRLATEILGNTCVEAVRVVSTELGTGGRQGRARPTPIAGTEEIIAADRVIVAYGFQPSPASWFSAHGVKTSTGGLLSTAGERSRFPVQTDNTRVFAGGVMVMGSSLVVHAVHQGRSAAQGIISFLAQGQPVTVA